jgi:hypothetical protein
MPERSAAVRLLPTRQPGPGTLRRACKRPLCGNEVDQPSGRSRPREFCSDGCRTLYQRERSQAKAMLMEAWRVATQYDIEDATPTDAPLPSVGSHDQLPRTSSPSPSHLALSLIAQALEEIRVDLRDGVPLNLAAVLDRLTRAKEEGDRLVRNHETKRHT